MIYEVYTLKFAFIGMSWTVENTLPVFQGQLWKTSVKETEWQYGAPV